MLLPFPSHPSSLAPSLLFSLRRVFPGVHSYLPDISLRTWAQDFTQSIRHGLRDAVRSIRDQGRAQEEAVRDVLERAYWDSGRSKYRNTINEASRKLFDQFHRGMVAVQKMESHEHVEHREILWLLMSTTSQRWVWFSFGSRSVELFRPHSNIPILFIPFLLFSCSFFGRKADIVHVSPFPARLVFFFSADEYKT